jgi:CheY-like chemotaxis protein
MQTVPHLLIAEDEDLVALAMAELLGASGFRVTVTDNGLAALQADETDPADLLITDMRMPVLDGTSLIALIRRRRPTLPIIVVTGYSDAMPAEEPGRLIVLHKPFALHGLPDAAMRLLAGGEPGRLRPTAPPCDPAAPHAPNGAWALRQAGMRNRAHRRATGSDSRH